MNHVERVFSQSDASRLSGVPQDVLRDWRRREFLDGLGEQGENGRWSYSFHEIILLAIVRALEDNRQPISILIFMAHHLSMSVINEFRKSDEYISFARANSAFWFNWADGHMMAPMAVHSLDDIDHIPSPNPQVILVNTAKLAQAMPDGIKLLLGERKSNA